MGRREEAKDMAAMQRAWDNREIVTPPATPAYRNNWDRTFRPKTCECGKPAIITTDDEKYLCADCYEAARAKRKEQNPEPE